MRRNQKQVTTQFILLGLLLIGVVYAILQANLQINGTAKIQANTWDIHFDNIVVNENSVSIGTGDSAATIDPENNCKVDFEVTLSIPGDFYEFTIDVVNAGTIDGMIGTLNKTLKVNNEVVEETPDYLGYYVTYSDGVEIEQNHKITAGTTETYIVRLEFKTDIEELPEATTISTSLTPQYIQADSTATSILHYKKLYDVFKIEASDEREIVIEYTGEHNDSYSTAGAEKIYHWHADSPAASNEIVSIIRNKWNVIFANFCWQMIRTTDTGGVKLLYNGVPSDGKCNITSGNDIIGTSKYNEYSYSPATVGYMYNPDTLISYVAESAAESGSLFGNGVSYDSSTGLYTLTNTSTQYNTTHHYSCNNTTGICSTVRYYYYFNAYTEISDGRDISQALNDMLNADNVNLIDSNVKTTVDTWYENNMTQYTDKLEDIVYCNDRTINRLGAWSPNGMTGLTLEFKHYNLNTNLYCTNNTDKFCISNSLAKLKYPVGLVTSSEIQLINNYKVINFGSKSWTMTPSSFYQYWSEVRIIDTPGTVNYDYVSRDNMGIRPVVSLKPGTTYRYGDGSKDNPYIIE